MVLQRFLPNTNEGVACSFVTLAIAGGLTFYSTALTAQNSPSLTLEEVLVTARKSEENLQDVPISITAFSADEIVNYGIRTLEDLDATVPNFVVNQGQGYAASTSLSIRGVTSRESASGFEPTIAVILDDVYIGRSLGFNSTILDMERIEVLRGPQGTLQGRNVVGGAINMVTSKPSDELIAKGRLSYARFGTGQVSGVVSGPLQEGVLAGKLAATYYETDGWGDNTALNRDQGKVDSTSVRGQLRFTPGDQLEVLLTGDFTTDNINDLGLDSDPNPTLTSPSKLLLDRIFASDFANDSSRDIYGAAANVYYELDNDMLLVSVSSYRGFEFHSSLDQDNTANIADGGGTVVHSSAPRDQNQFSQEFRLHSPQDHSVRWLAGLYYYYEDLDTLGGSIFGPFVPGVGALGTYNWSDATIETDAYAAFGSVTVDFAEDWTLTAGVRYDDNNRDLDIEEFSGLDGLLPPPSPELPPTPYVSITSQIPNPKPVPKSFAIVTEFPTNSESVDDGEWTGDVSLTYQVDDERSVYGKYSRGFKGGGFNSQFGFGDGGGVVDPEFVDAYELGLRSYWLDRRLRLNATAFVLEYKDQQVVDFEVGPEGFNYIVFNEPKTDSYGAEIEALMILAEQLTLTVGVGLLDSEFEGGDNDGNTPADSPEFTFSSILQWTTPVSSSLDLMLLAEANYSDDYYTLPDNQPLSYQDDYWMIDSRVALQSNDGRWSVAIWGKNLTDEDVVVTGFAVNQSLLSLDEPRTYGVEFSFSF